MNARNSTRDVFAGFIMAEMDVEGELAVMHGMLTAVQEKVVDWQDEGREVKLDDLVASRLSLLYSHLHRALYVVKRLQEGVR